MLKGGSYISHGTMHRSVNFFFQFAKETKEYLEVNDNIRTTTEGYGT